MLNNSRKRASNLFPATDQGWILVFRYWILLHGLQTDPLSDRQTTCTNVQSKKSLTGIECRIHCLEEQCIKQLAE